MLFECTFWTQCGSTWTKNSRLRFHDKAYFFAFSKKIEQHLSWDNRTTFELRQSNNIWGETIEQQRANYSLVTPRIPPSLQLLEQSCSGFQRQQTNIFAFIFSRTLWIFWPKNKSGQIQHQRTWWTFVINVFEGKTFWQLFSTTSFIHLFWKIFLLAFYF